MILLNISQEAITHFHPIWDNVFFYLFIGMIMLFAVGVMFMVKALNKKTAETKLLQQQYVARMDAVRKEHANAMEKIRVEMLKREEDRSRQWMESEKETLHVLNGVSTLLDLSDKIGRVESDKILTSSRCDAEAILSKLSEIQDKVDKMTSHYENTKSNES